MSTLAYLDNPDKSGGAPIPRGDSDAARSGREHVVQFYESDDRLVDSVASFLAEGLRAGEPAIVIATEAHRAALPTRLAALGVDVEAERAKKQLVMLDAAETLSGFMVGDAPDPLLFEATVGRVLDAAAATLKGSAPVVRAFGEMVDLLWRGGNPGAALRLEEMWSDIQKVRRFSLFCAYAMASFYRQSAGVQRVCDQHTRIVSHADGDAGAESAEALEVEVAGRLETSDVRTLSHEIAQRKRIEQALRDSLRDLRRHEEEEESRRRRAERLAQITSAIADAVTPDQVFEAVVDRVGIALGASSAALWLVQPGGSSAALARATGYSEAALGAVQSLALEGAGFPAGDAIRRGEPIWLSSRQELIAAYPHLAGLASAGRSYRIACLPVVAGGEVIGSLGLTFDDAPPLDEDGRSFMRLVARYSGQALERLTLLRDNQQARVRAELLYGLARSVIAARGAGEVFEAALRAIEAALSTDRASILTFDRDGVMRFKAWRGLSDGYRDAVEGHSPWSRDSRDPAPIVISDAAVDPTMTSYLPLFRREGIGALAFIPLVADGRLLGKFMVYYSRPRALAPQELDLARAIADHVAAAISRFAAVAELEQTVRFNELFAGVLGHDLRNPLGAILSSARLALMRNPGEKLAKPLSRILTSGDRMARMINQLLDFTRVRVGEGIPLSRDRLELVAIVRQVMDELDDANPDWTLRLEQQGDTAGTWDADRLSQVFSNLVGNAVQHGVVSRGVDVLVDGGSDDSVTVRITSGGTIPPNLLPTLFEPLAGGGRRLQRSRGLGLGLYITREIVAAHGGRIEVRSDDSIGTTFTVVLPRQPRPGPGPTAST